MITRHLLMTRLSKERKGGPDYEARLTPFAFRIHKWFIRRWPFVTKRRFVMLKLERDRLIHELYMAMCEMNDMEAKKRARILQRRARLDDNVKSLKHKDISPAGPPEMPLPTTAIN